MGRACAADGATSEKLAYGDALDFWRVTGVERDKRLELRAEMKLPGEALLEFDIDESEDGSLITQTALFKPRGLAGLVYWWAVFPLHGFVFRGMLRGIRRTAEELHSAETKPVSERPAPEGPS